MTRPLIPTRVRQAAPAPRPGSEPLRPSSLADIASGLARTAHLWRTHDGLEHPSQRTGLRLIRTPEYDVWLLRWPPGTSVSPHDHGGSAGAFAVADGELREIRWCGPVRRTRVLGPGETVVIEPGVVHDVLADTAVAWSVHVYSPPLSTIGFYDGDGAVLLARAPVDADHPAVAGPVRFHPAGSAAEGQRGGRATGVLGTVGVLPVATDGTGTHPPAPVTGPGPDGPSVDAPGSGRWTRVG